MLTEKKEAAALTTAQNYISQSETYHTNTNPSSKKVLSQLGEILLKLPFINDHDIRNGYWNLFESKLREYYDLRAREVVR